MPTLNILVVDDDRDFADSMAEVLELHGHVVTRAFSGEEATRLFQRTCFDLAFMDVRLPGKNGVECFLDIRSIQPDARVIMMTGFRVENLLRQASENGATGILRKPFDIDRALEMVAGIRPGGILLVDDDPDFLTAITEILVDRGYSVCVARDGVEAIEHAKNHPVDILVLDLRMPVLGGLETYRRLREMGVHLPTIVVTAHAREEEGCIAQLRDLAVSGVLTKPFDPDILLEMVDTLTSGGNGTRCNG